MGLARSGSLCGMRPRAAWERADGQQAVRKGKPPKAPAPGFAQMGRRRTPRITGDTLRGYLLAAAALARVIPAKDHLPCGGKACDQHPQPDVPRGQGRLSRTMPAPVIVDAIWLLAHSHHPQAGRYGPCSRSENSAD
jgi:hypothetical protein